MTFQHHFRKKRYSMWHWCQRKCREWENLDWKPELVSVAIWWHICANNPALLRYTKNKQLSMCLGNMLHRNQYEKWAKIGRYRPEEEENFTKIKEDDPSVHLASILSWENAFIISSSVKLPVTQIHVCCLNVNLPNIGWRFRVGNDRVLDLVVVDHNKGTQVKIYCRYLICHIQVT